MQVDNDDDDDDEGSVWERGANHVPSKFEFFFKIIFLCFRIILMC
jgi:hypothetical protein